MTQPFRSGGDPLGVHRVISPRGALPQGAERLDATMPPFDDEALIGVERLNIDAASFEQLMAYDEETGTPVADQIRDIVGQRGKMQNPVTGSGGMLIGRLEARGPRYTGPLRGAEVGSRVATLVSLTLTPLRIDSVHAVHAHAHQVEVSGHAILFSSAPAAVLPDDLPEPLALAVLDVCGAPAQVIRYADPLGPGATVLVMGAGKSGLLSLAALASLRRPERPLRVLAIDRFDAPLAQVRALGLADATVALECSDAVAVREAVTSHNHGQPADLVVNMASLPHTEMGAVLAARQGATVLFFGMATSFTRSTLGAEGVGADVRLVMGNGFMPGCAEAAIDLVRANAGLRDVLTRRLEQR